MYVRDVHRRLAESRDVGGERQVGVQVKLSDDVQPHAATCRSGGPRHRRGRLRGDRRRLCHRKHNGQHRESHGRRVGRLVQHVARAYDVLSEAPFGGPDRSLSRVVQLATGLGTVRDRLRDSEAVVTRLEMQQDTPGAPGALSAPGPSTVPSTALDQRARPNTDDAESTTNLAPLQVEVPDGLQ